MFPLSPLLLYRHFAQHPLQILKHQHITPLIFPGHFCPCIFFVNGVFKSYPQRVFKDEPTLASMIVGISDVYDALRSKRSYAGEMCAENVYNEIRRTALDGFKRLNGPGKEDQKKWAFPAGTLETSIIRGAPLEKAVLRHLA